MSWYSKLLDAIFIFVGMTPSGDQPINKFGLQDDVDQADVTAGLAADNKGQIVWNIKAGTQAYKFIDALTTKVVKVVSSSALDTLLGTGAQKVTLIYQDTLGVQQELEVDMAGVADVAFAPIITGCFRCFVSQTGSTNSNAGRIDLKDTTTGDIYASIQIGKGQSVIAVQKIPVGKKGTVKSHYAKFAKATTPATEVDVSLFVRKADGTFQLKYPGTITNIVREDSKDYIVGGIQLEAGDHVFHVVETVSADSIPVEAGFDITIEDA